MNIKTLIFAAFSLCISFNSFGQLDLKEKAQLMGIQVDERAGSKKDLHRTDISFIFSGKPTQYFHVFKDSILELQFYDAILGEEKLQEIAKSPFISGSKIVSEKINVNKDIEGLTALYKDVVKVTLPIEKGVGLDFTVSDDFNVITLATVWSKTAKVKGALTGTKSKTKAVVFGSVIGITAGVIGYVVLKKDTPPPPPPTEWDPNEFTLPPLP